MSDLPDSQALSSEERPAQETPLLAKEYHITSLQRIAHMLYGFTPFERLLLYLFSILLSVSTLILVVAVNQNVIVTVPASGGVLKEGTIGTPRFINPLLAISEADQDISMLVYSGLVRATPEGNLIPDLAESYEISSDGTMYTFHLRPKATFHDGTPITADDVIFTISLAQNPDIKSPKRADWEGVTAKALDSETIVFTLPNAYAPFLENAQLGILPKHLWNGISPEEFQFHALNTHPIGSGPYAIFDISKDATGAPVGYTLKAFNAFVLGKPYLSTITFTFFSNEEGLLRGFSDGTIDSFAGVTPDQAVLATRVDTQLLHADSTRVFGVFFNQNRAAVFTDRAARKALEAAVGRKNIVQSVLGGAGKVLHGPIPPALLSGEDTDQELPPEERAEAARQILRDDKWEFNEMTGLWTKNKQTLSFALATADTPELVATADALAKDWEAAGIKVDVQIYPLAEFNPNVLRPRAYDAVVFGEVVGRTLDLFAFWHSSQRNDPGLNLALYANASADRLLASARIETNKRERAKLYRDFVETLDDDKPAVFLYTPDFVYLLPKKIQGVQLGSLTSPAERFLDAYHWYTDTENVWDLFTNRNLL